MAHAQLLSGKEVAQDILNNLAKKIKLLSHPPTLAVILVGKNPASQIYVKNKKLKAQEVGIISKDFIFEDNITEAELLSCINQLNHDENINGILLQLPLPEDIDKNKIIESIAPHKDVDGFHPYHLGRLAQGRPSIRPCTPHGIIRLLDFYRINLKSLNAVIVGSSNIVGKPMALELILAGSTVTLCNSKTQNLESHIRSADLVISATGKQGLINPDWFKSGTILVDVGIHRLEDGTVTGDVDFTKALLKTAFITPVPGGVGPMTIAMLLENTYLLSLHKPK